MIQLTQIHNEGKLNFLIRPENWVHAKLDFKSLGIKFTLNTKVLGKVWPGFKNKYDLDIYDLNGFDLR